MFVIWVVPFWLALIILWIEAGSHQRAARREIERDAARAEKAQKI